MCLKRRHSVPIVFLTSPRGRIRHVVFVCSSHRDTFPVHFFTLAPFFAFSLICLSYINKSFVMKISKWVAFFPARNCKVTFFMKRSYLLPRENFKLSYIPNQAHWDPGICIPLRSSHIHCIHQKSREFVKGNLEYLALICVVWSSRDRAGKKVTAVTFFRCPTVN